MREIKFRAWDKNEKSMWNLGVLNIERIDELYEECELMQYTGLKDKNRKKIYEGDIVHKSKDNGTWIIEYDNNDAKFIAFNNLNSLRDLETDPNTEGAIFGITEEIEIECEIIGNIYENLEFLN